MMNSISTYTNLPIKRTKLSFYGKQFIKNNNKHIPSLAKLLKKKTNRKHRRPEDV